MSFFAACLAPERWFPLCQQAEGLARAGPRLFVVKPRHDQGSNYPLSQNDLAATRVLHGISKFVARLEVVEVTVLKQG